MDYSVFLLSPYIYIYVCVCVCCDSQIEEELNTIKEIFINNGCPEEVIDNDINITVTRFKNKNKIFGPPKCPVYFRLPWIGPASQSFAETFASFVYRCYHAVKIDQFSPLKRPLTPNIKTCCLSWTRVY